MYSQRIHLPVVLYEGVITTFLEQKLGTILKKAEIKKKLLSDITAVTLKFKADIPITIEENLKPFLKFAILGPDAWAENPEP